MSAQGFHDWSIRYAISDHGGPPFPGAQVRLTEGQLTVWEVPDYDDRYVVAPAGVTVRELRFGDDEIRFRLDGVPDGGADIHVRCAWFPRWRAHQEGRLIPLVATPPHPGAKAKQEQLLVHASNGEVVLTCDAPMPRFWAGLLFTLLGVGGLIVCAPAKGCCARAGTACALGGDRTSSRAPAASDARC
jgi:hypothetical protein